MDASGLNLQGLAFLGVAAATAMLVAFGLIRFLLGLWRWTFGGPRDRGSKLIDTVAKEPVIAFDDPKLTATHILAIRSNLDAVSRQLADLELRLRLHS
jgi:hypothetical protein